MSDVTRILNAIELGDPKAAGETDSQRFYRLVLSPYGLYQYSFLYENRSFQTP
jgi:hypothetical protein